MPEDVRRYRRCGSRLGRRQDPGPSAFICDTEPFENNRLVAGELDMWVAWQANYSDRSEDEETTDAATFFEATKGESNVGSGGGIVLSSVTCNEMPSNGITPWTVFEINDADPGNFGFTAFNLGSYTAHANSGTSGRTHG